MNNLCTQISIKGQAITIAGKSYSVKIDDNKVTEKKTIELVAGIFRNIAMQNKLLADNLAASKVEVKYSEGHSGKVVGKITTIINGHRIELDKNNIITTLIKKNKDITLEKICLQILDSKDSSVTEKKKEKGVVEKKKEESVKKIMVAKEETEKVVKKKVLEKKNVDDEFEKTKAKTKPTFLKRCGNFFKSIFTGIAKFLKIFLKPKNKDYRKTLMRSNCRVMTR